MKNKVRDDFCFFILTHGRADRIDTLKTLERLDYNGAWFLVIDDGDKEKDKYIEKYGDKVLIFNKDEEETYFDIGDIFDNQKVIVYARNVCMRFAKELGYKYFMELDDDYTSIGYRFNREGTFKHQKIKNFNFLMNKTIEFYENSKALYIAFAQGGDYIGGENGAMGEKLFLKRKAMNSILCSVDRPFKFVGRINEDVNTYVNLGSKGNLIFTLNNVALEQRQTQSNSGGMTDVYIESGTYLKSFYSVMYNPSCVKISKMGNHKETMRIHHKVFWNNAVPQIISEKYKK